jgi:hypothetical protein
MRVVTDDDDLIEFAFTSVVPADLPRAVLPRLAHQSSVFNRRMGLTGELVLDGNRFSQVVEGACAVVEALAARVLADPRHCRIRISSFGRLVGGRRHGAWSVRGFEFQMPRLVQVAHPHPEIPSGAFVEEIASTRRHAGIACIP